MIFSINLAIKKILILPCLFLWPNWKKSQSTDALMSYYEEILTEHTEKLREFFLIKAASSVQVLSLLWPTDSC